jgi:hypothetical protein
MHALIVETGKHKGKRLRIAEGESIVGRDETAQVRIASEEVSRSHCVLISHGDRLVVRDLNSSNGTFVNGKPITEETVLNPGDLLVVGPMGFRLPAPEPPPPAVPKPIPAKKLVKDKSTSLSDDDIQSWLGLHGGAADGDASTKVIAAALPSAGEEAPSTQPRRIFKSVADEAADIIRRHQERAR